MTTETRFYDLAYIKTANSVRGHHFFEAGTLRFFRSRVGAEVYQGPGGVFFVTSEQFVAGDGTAAARLFTVREFKPESGRIEKFGPFNELTRARAHRLARLAAEDRAAAESSIA